MREFSAGGVVVNDHGQAIVIVPTRPTADGRRVLALPKGHPEHGESAEQAAVREVREETGAHAEVVEPLGEVRYFYQRDGRRIAKVVAFFLLRYVSGSLSDHDHEVRDARWMALGDAVEQLTHEGEREMAARAAARLRAAR